MQGQRYSSRRLNCLRNIYGYKNILGQFSEQSVTTSRLTNAASACDCYFQVLYFKWLISTLLIHLMKAGMFLYRAQQVRADFYFNLWCMAY